MQIGGQAVIEGVMMRSKSGVATAVRKENGKIVVQTQAFASKTAKKPYSLPVIRGAVVLIESLYLGFMWLSFSADAASGDESEESLASKVLQIAGSIALAVLLFLALPYFITGRIPLEKAKSPLAFNLIAGAIRITFFLAYLYLLGFVRDVRRVFEYHGAEHKCIACHEAKTRLSLANIRKFSSVHPRCGTSYLLIAGMSCILVFAVADAMLALFWPVYASPPWHLRLAVHLPLIPFVSGVSYELLKLLDRHRDNPVMAVMALPGLMLQKLTTRKPDDRQIEVARAALKAVLRL